MQRLTRTWKELSALLRSHVTQQHIVLNWSSTVDADLIQQQRDDVDLSPIRLATGLEECKEEATPFVRRQTSFPGPWLFHFIKHLFPGAASHKLSNIWGMLHTRVRAPPPVYEWHVSRDDALALRDIVFPLLQDPELNAHLDGFKSI